MFNPYVSGRENVLRPAPKPPGGPERILKKLGKLDREDLLVLALIWLLAGEGEEDRIWPLVAAMLYLLL